MQEIERQEAVLFTSLLGKETPFDFLVAASRDRDEDVQILVCIALEALAEWANPEWLIPLVNSGDQEVRGHAGQALIPYGDRIPLEPVLQSLLTRGADYEDPRVEALGALKERFPRATLEQLVHSDGELDREVAALIIGNMGEAAPIDLLATLLAMPYSRETHGARLHALEATQKLKAPQLALRLAELMREEPSNEFEWHRKETSCDSAPPQPSARWVILATSQKSLTSLRSSIPQLYEHERCAGWLWRTDAGQRNDHVHSGPASGR